MPSKDMPMSYDMDDDAAEIATHGSLVQRRTLMVLLAAMVSDGAEFNTVQSVGNEIVAAQVGLLVERVMERHPAISRSRALQITLDDVMTRVQLRALRKADA